MVVNEKKDAMRSTSFMLALAVTITVITASRGIAWEVYYGDLHTHCSASDGKGTPEEAYTYARETAHADYLALTDHNKAKLTQEAVDGVTEAAAKTKTSTFAPVFGQEFSTNENGNHVNVFGIGEPIPETINNDFRRLYREWLPQYRLRHPQDLVFCQFNHPRNKNADYGISAVKNGQIPNYGGDWAGFVADADPWVKLIALVNGPAQKVKEPPHGLHKDILMPLVNTWLFYLDKGMHLAPTCNHDTHVESWGDLSTGRTGVWLDEPLSSKALLKSLNEGHCFATEDKNLSLWFELGGAVMGTRLPDMGSTNLPVVVKVIDKDENDSRYTVEVYRDVVGDGNLAKVFASGVVSAGDTYTAEFPHAKGVTEFCLVHVKQIDADDDAWSAAIFIGPAAATDDDTDDAKAAALDGPAFAGDVKFVSAKGSRTCHYTSCKVVQRIKPENLQTYERKPEGYTLHKNCLQE